jgi:hypothetical protein
MKGQKGQKRPHFTLKDEILGENNNNNYMWTIIPMTETNFSNSEETQIGQILPPLKLKKTAVVKIGIPARPPPTTKINLSFQEADKPVKADQQIAVFKLKKSAAAQCICLTIFVQ